MRRQQGFGLLLVFMVLVLVGAGIFLGAAPGTGATQSERAAEEARTLAIVRDALIAYALAGGTNNRPGALPCPDTDGDGASDNTACQGSGWYVGRLPLATLDLSRGLLPGSDEIWYVVDEDFDDFDNVSPLPPVNTGSSADLEIDGQPGFPAAIILARDPVAGQTRPGNAVAAHLEGDNADGDAAFASCDASDCNDRVLGISTRALLDPVRKRLLGAIAEALDDRLDTGGDVPFAALLGDDAGACDDGTPPRGRGTLPVADGSCGTGGSLAGDLPGWITDNEWHRWVYYAAADPCTPGGAGCNSGATGLLNLSGAPGKAAIIATVGRPINTPGNSGNLQDRSGAPPPALDVRDFLDSDENTDADDVFDDPANGANENDRLRAIDAPSP